MRESFRGNENLKSPKVGIEWTAEQIIEYKKCLQDPVYFTKTYMKIVNLDRGLVNFDLYNYQEKLINTYITKKRVIVLSSRQSGKSITTIAFLLWYTLFHDHKTVAILANKGDSARGLLARYRLAYEHLPIWLQQGVVEWNKGSIELENGCTILAGSTSSSAVRSRAINVLLLDEFAFVPKNLADDFFKSVYPTISSGKESKIIIVSTANGMNHYHKMWSEAERGDNSYTPIRVDWWDVPGRDEAWKEATIRDTSEEQFAQEFDNNFLGTSNTLISPVVIKNLVHQIPIYDKDGLKVYEQPDKRRRYAITVDCSEGLGMDYSVANVIDITSYPYKQVAIYRSDTIDPHLLSGIIFDLGTNFNVAPVLCEINSVGELVAKDLYMDLEYQGLLFVTKKGIKGQVLGSGFGGANKIQYGLKTTKQTKRIGCAVAKTLIENGKLILVDYDTIAELTTFVRDKQTYAAEPGFNDDTCMSLVLFAWMTNQQYFKDEMEQNLRQVMAKDNEDFMDEMLTPFGHIDSMFHEQEAIDPRYQTYSEEVWSPGPTLS